MRSPGSEYIGNRRAMAQAIIRQQRAVRKRSPAMFEPGPRRTEVRQKEREDGTIEESTVEIVGSPAAVAIPPERVMRLYTQADARRDREVRR